MFVLDGAKARIAALTLAAATAIPLFPRAQAAESPKAAAPVITEAKAPKKTKKKKATVAQPTPKPRTNPKRVLSHPIVEWGPKPVFPKLSEHLTRQKKLKVVIETAEKQLGKPYHYGSAGPNSFDCSGFTMWVWRHVGVSLPHSSRGQYASLTHVSRDKAQPGDIVYSPGHVGLYLGDGKMIHAPQTGDHVRIAPLQSNTVGFARPPA